MRGVILIAALFLAACQQQPGPDAAVQAIYAAATPRLAHGQPTTLDEIPLSTEFKAAIDHASTVADQRNEPFIDGDLAFNCQDCRVATELQTVVTHPPANGHAVVEARFKLDGQATVVIWDMVQTPQGWRVENIRSPDGYDLKQAAQQEIAQENVSCADDRGAEEAASLVERCTQVSPATHPPCNAANTCRMIEAEITRGCGLLSGKDKPAFCAEQTGGAAP